MKKLKRDERNIRDSQIASKCGRCCLCCKKYKRVKDQDKKCEVVKARRRLINRSIYQFKKKRKHEITFNGYDHMMKDNKGVDERKC